MRPVLSRPLLRRLLWCSLNHRHSIGIRLRQCRRADRPGQRASFVGEGALFTLAGGLAVWLSNLQNGRDIELPKGPLFGGIPEEFRKSWRALTSDVASALALGQLTMSSTLVLLFAILIPRYMQDILGVSADSAALIFAPTGVGALVEIMETTPGPLNPGNLLGLSLLQSLTMMFAAPMGFSYALLNAPAQTVLHERAPPEMRGRIFATQVVSANFVSLLPPLVAGAITAFAGG